MSREVNIRVFFDRLIIDFPALSAYVAYLQGEEQKEVDVMAQEVKDLTSSLTASAADLQKSVDNQH